MARIRRVVFYAVNGSGMGHITRLLAVARWLRRYLAVLEERAPEIVFLTSSEATGVLLEAGFASFKLPSKTVVRQAGMDMLEYRRLARQFVWQMLGVFAPDLLVVDTFPAGSFDELFQVLDGPFRKALILRHVKAEFARRPIYRAAVGLYPAVVVPHTRAAFGVDELPAPAERVTFAGEVLQFERDELPLRAAAREELGVPPDARLIYLSAGGGGDPGSEEALHALVDALRPLPEVHLLVGAGPLYRGRRLGGERLTWFTNPQVFQYFPACDAAISAGGYNTFHELLYCRVPTLFFAQPKVADDQAGRIARAAAAGACASLSDPLDAEAVRSGIAALLEAARGEAMAAACAGLLPDNGAARCARALLEGSYPASALSWATGLVSSEVARAFEGLGVEGLGAMGRWLPQLVPQARWGALHAERSFQALLDQLDPEVAARVSALAREQPEAAAMNALQAHLGALLTQASAWSGGLEQATGLLDAAAKKHPLTQEAEGRWAAWMASLLERLRATLARPVPGWEAADIAQVYRAFPRLLDADAAASFGAFDALLARAAARRRSAAEVILALRALKFSQQRPTLEVVSRWIEEAL